jgi:hypothetical protein
MHLRRYIIVLAILNVIGAGCQTKEQSKATGLIDSMEGNFPLWPDPNNIPVCWYRPQYSTVRQDYNDEVKRIVQEQYSRAGIFFTGWDKCDGTSAFDPPEIDKGKVKILIIGWPTINKVNDFGNRTKTVYLAHQDYYDNSSKKSKVFKVSNPVTKQSEVACPSNNGMNCVRNYALHEFGHVVGLHHEAGRPDHNCNLSIGDETVEGNTTMLGNYDADSIMEYCNNVLKMIADESPILSEGDIRTIKTMYFDPLVNIVVRTQPTEANVNVAFLGHNSTHYKYKIGLYGEIDCGQEAGYSESFPIEQSLQVSTMLDPSKKLLICALANNGSNVQPLDRYSSFILKGRSLQN